LQGKTYFLPSLGRAGTFLCSTNGQQAFIFEPGSAPAHIARTEQVFLIATPPVAAQAIPGTATLGPGPDGRPLPAVLPPDAPASDPLTSSEPTKAAPTAETAPATEEKPKRKRRTKEEIAADEAAALAPEASVTAAAVAQREAAAPTSWENVSTAPVFAVAQQEAPSPPSDEGAAPETGFAGIRLFIGCRPDAGSKRLDDYISTLKAKMNDKFKVKDPRLTPRLGTGVKDKDHPLAFDGWKGILATLVALDPPAPGAYHAIGQCDFAEVVVPALAALLPPENVTRAG
jgi:hypothetical protein